MLSQTYNISRGAWPSPAARAPLRELTLLSAFSTLTTSGNRGLRAGCRPLQLRAPAHRRNRQVVPVASTTVGYAHLKLDQTTVVSRNKAWGLTKSRR